MSVLTCRSADLSRRLAVSTALMGLLVVAIVRPATGQQREVDFGSLGLARSAVGQAGAGELRNVVTYARDVAPILQRSCQECHQPGSIGPMSLLNYEEVRPWARVIKLRVQEQQMPPYHYDTDVGIQELKYDRRLTREEIGTISRWVDAGAPLGDPADLPPPVEWPDATEWRFAANLGAPDLVVQTTPFTVPANGQDTWWRPIVPTGITQDRCIRAISVKPSLAGRATVHHANSDLLVPNEKGEYVQLERVSEYALGKLGELIPPDACRILPANSLIKWDIHYFPMGEEVVDDVVELGFWLYPEDYQAKYKQNLRSYTLLMKGGDIDIAPHGTTMTQGFHTFRTPVRIDSFQPHGHARLVAKSLEIFYPETGQLEVISRISNWTNNWHLSHMYEDDVAPLVPKGAVLVITAWYDNTVNNPQNPDPDQWVGRGSRTTDEMSHAWIAVTHLDDEGYERQLADRKARAETGSGSTDR